MKRPRYLEAGEEIRPLHPEQQIFPGLTLSVRHGARGSQRARVVGISGSSIRVQKWLHNSRSWTGTIRTVQRSEVLGAIADATKW